MLNSCTVKVRNFNFDDILISLGRSGIRELTKLVNPYFSSFSGTSMG